MHVALDGPKRKRCLGSCVHGLKLGQAGARGGPGIVEITFVVAALAVRYIKVELKAAKVAKVRAIRPRLSGPDLIKIIIIPLD